MTGISSDNMQPVLEKYMNELSKALKAIPENKVIALAELIYETSMRGNTVYLFGNGDSANNALHYALDLGKGTIKEGKKRLRLISLTENIGLITAWGNDESYESIFKEQLENLAKPGDLVIGISGSGNSPNVLRAIEYANKIGATTFALTAFGGGKVKDIAKHSIIADTHNMEVAEAVHWVISDLVKYYLMDKIMK